jgi:hypothetical protein
MKKILTTMFVGLLCLSMFSIFAPNVKAEGTTTGFESGFGGWQSFTQYGGIAQLSTTYAHSGTHSVEQSGHSSGSDPYSSVGRIRFPVALILDEYELSAWVYVTERSDANAASFFGFAFNWPGGTPPDFREVVGWGPWGSGSSYVHVRQSEGYTPKGNWYNPVSYGLTLNTWHQVKVMVYTNLGTVSIWLDGSLIVDNWPAFNAGEKPDYYDIECSANYYGTYAMHQYVDDVYVSEVARVSVDISPLYKTVYLPGQTSVALTSTVTGGAPPYAYRWYSTQSPNPLDSGDGLAFNSTVPGIFYVYLVVTDANNSTAQSEMARIVFATLPVGGYSFQIDAQATAKPLIPYFALLAILMTILTSIKRKTKRETKKRS